MNTFFPGNKNSGMTFLEVVVVVGIFSVISAVVLFSYRDFSNSIRLQNLSQEIALQGKRAQTLASQGRRPILSQAQILNEGLLPFSGWVSSYGIAFRLPENNKSFFLENKGMFPAAFDRAKAAESLRAGFEQTENFLNENICAFISQFAEKKNEG